MSRVEPNRNVYVGHRYVPKIFGEWDKQNEYEGLSIVTHQGASYTSKKRVPVGIDILNEEFWVVTGNYDSQVENYRQEVNAMKDSVDESLEKTVKKDELIVNVMDHGAKGDGVTVDSDAIDNAIEYALEHKRNIYFPAGKYLINRTIFTKGLSVYGDPGNVYTDDQGSIILCQNKGFTAISQGYESVRDIQFEYKYLIVENADIGFEINYVINSEFNNLYAKNCNVGYKLGDLTSVGSMFNEFNNFYTRNCEIGIESESNEYFNNNVFNNGFIQGNEYSAKFHVNGGYGGVNNTFNNVEFKSNLGRGIILYRMSNTVFNTCYFENGGRSVLIDTASSAILNDNVYALFKADNSNNDKEVIYITNTASRSIINGGTLFLDSNYNDKHFLTSDIKYPKEWLSINNDLILKNTQLSTNFNLYNRNYNKYLNNVRMNKFIDLLINEDTFNPVDQNVIKNFNIIENTENVKSDGKIILTEGHWLINVTLKLELNNQPASKYLYIKKNGVNILSESHSFEDAEKDLKRFTLNKVIKAVDGDVIEIVFVFENSTLPIKIVGNTHSFASLKYLG